VHAVHAAQKKLTGGQRILPHQTKTENVIEVKLGLRFAQTIQTTVRGLRAGVT